LPVCSPMRSPPQINADTYEWQIYTFGRHKATRFNPSNFT